MPGFGLCIASFDDVHEYDVGAVLAAAALPSATVPVLVQRIRGVFRKAVVRPPRRGAMPVRPIGRLTHVVGRAWSSQRPPSPPPPAGLANMP